MAGFVTAMLAGLALLGFAWRQVVKEERHRREMAEKSAQRRRLSSESLGEGPLEPEEREVIASTQPRGGHRGSHGE